MSLFAIGDLHLSEGAGVNKPMDIYGGAWVGHAKRLSENWRALVLPEDTVIIPGDVSWALHLKDALPDLAWVDALPGKKVIIKGNHDLWWASLAKMQGLFPSIEFLQNNAYDGGNFIIFGSRGWLCPGDKLFSEEKDRKIYERELIRLRLSVDAAKKLFESAKAEGRRPVLIGAMHYPPTDDKKEESGFTEIFSEAGAAKVIYGHLHGEKVFPNGPSGLIGGTRYINVSLDRLCCLPLRIL